MTIRCCFPFMLGWAALLVQGGFSSDQAQSAPITAFTGGRWLQGTSFRALTAYSVNGRFTFRKPARIDRTINLSGTWVVPPFAEAHNHNIGTGVPERDRQAIRRYLDHGVFYVKIQGNMPLSGDARRRLGLNVPGGLDAVFAQGSLTSPGGHPIALVEMLLERQGYFPGFTRETLQNNRYFTIDSEADLSGKWQAILDEKPDFIKTFLWFSDEFERRRSSPAFFGQKGLDPRLLPEIVVKAHAAGLKVSTHVINAADFHYAVAAGVDEIAHLPPLGLSPISAEDARAAARLGIVVDTTAGVLRTLPAAMLPPEAVAAALKRLKDNLQTLREHAVRIAVGSDNVGDSSAAEVEYLKKLVPIDNLDTLTLWTETAKTIFPDRRIGKLGEGFEASFLALDGDPLTDWSATRRIRVRCKQGVLLD